MSNIVRRINNVVYGPKVDVSINKRGIGRYVFDKMQEHGEKTFQINAADGEQQAYKFVNRKSIRVALEMRERGIKKSDLVLLCLSNSMDNVVPLLSTLYLNAITVTLDPSISLRDTTYLLNLVRPKMIFVQESAIELIESALKNADYKTEVVVVGNHEKFSTYSKFLEPKPNEEDFIPDDVENIRNTSVIFFSSGTTGLPKAIELSHYSIIYCVESAMTLGFSHKTILFFTSYYWISAVTLTILSILKGTKKVVVRTFEPELALKTIHNYKVTDTFFAPTFSYLITEDLIKKYPCPELETILFSGSTLNAEQLKKMRTYFPNCTITLAYAQTESGGLITNASISNAEKFKNKLNCSGQPAINTEIKIVDFDTNKLLELNELGEIRIKIPSACSGYYNQDSSNIFDEDGYIKTGDVGYFDEDDCLYICDRIKDMFKYQSWHIVPLSLENVIAEHPSVAEVLVIGIPSEANGHIPMALVVLRKDAPATNENDLLQFANNNLSEREQLRAGLKIVKRIPKGPTGKVMRKNITELIVSGQLQKLLE